MTSQLSRERGQDAALVGSDRKKGAAVYRADGTKVGQIELVMIDRTSGEVAYAVISCGAGQDRYPLPWSLLTYNAAVEGYDANVTDAQLKGAPKYCRDKSWDWASRERGAMLKDYYNVPPM